MRLGSAMLCPEDDEVFEGSECPRCLNRAIIPVHHWLKPAASGCSEARKKKRVKEMKKPELVKKQAKG